VGHVAFLVGQTVLWTYIVLLCLFMAFASGSQNGPKSLLGRIVLFVVLLFLFYIERFSPPDWSTGLRP